MTTLTSKNKSSVFLNISSYLKSLLLLMKPRVMSLVIFTCAVGLLTSQTTIPLFDSLISIFFVTIGAGAAGALNMWYEADLDKLMTRTCLRPIPTGKINRQHALIFGVVLSIISVCGLYYFSNLLSAFLLLVTISFYLFVYTIWLKRKTPQNIVIGGASGALPPVIGWTIATNSLTIEPITFFLIIFYWTPSHFWALSLFKTQDYSNAKIPMLPVVAGIKKTKINIFIYSIILFFVSLIPIFFDNFGLIYLISSILLGTYYVYLCYKLLIENQDSNEKIISKKIFFYSILYLFLIFSVILIDSLL